METTLKRPKRSLKMSYEKLTIHNLLSHVLRKTNDTQFTFPMKTVYVVNTIRDVEFIAQSFYTYFTEISPNLALRNQNIH